MIDGLCVCGHDHDSHAVGGDYCRVPDCCCEGWLADDEPAPRNGDQAEAEPSELSGRGWSLGPFV